MVGWYGQYYFLEEFYDNTNTVSLNTVKFQFSHQTETALVRYNHWPYGLIWHSMFPSQVLNLLTLIWWSQGTFAFLFDHATIWQHYKKKHCILYTIIHMQIHHCTLLSSDDPVRKLFFFDDINLGCQKIFFQLNKDNNGILIVWGDTTYNGNTAVLSWSPHVYTQKHTVKTLY